MTESTVHVAIGGNLGDVEANLSQAVRLIDALENTRVSSVSSLYRTAPVGGPVDENGKPAQPDFYNGAVEVITSLKPLELLKALLGIELGLGRRRTVQDGPRTVDLDVILWEHLVLMGEELTLPHPRMHTRGFVLLPLAEIAPNAVHPVLKESMANLLSRLPDTEKTPQKIPFAPLEDTRD